MQFFIDLLYEIESITSFHRHIDMKFEMRFFLFSRVFFLKISFLRFFFFFFCGFPFFFVFKALV